MPGLASHRVQGAPERPNRSVSIPKPGPKAAEAPWAPHQGGMGLHTADGLRKYLTAGERDAFLREAERADRAVRTLCMTLAYAGCRLSEALALALERVDLAAGVLTFESLKKRRSGVHRSVPVPAALLTRSTWCMVSVSSRPRAAAVVVSACGPGAG